MGMNIESSHEIPILAENHVVPWPVAFPNSLLNHPNDSSTETGHGY